MVLYHVDMIYTKFYFGLDQLELHSCDSFLPAAVFAGIREIWSGAPLGEISVFGTRYECESDIYHVGTTLRWRVSWC